MPACLHHLVCIKDSKQLKYKLVLFSLWTMSIGHLPIEYSKDRYHANMSSSAANQ